MFCLAFLFFCLSLISAKDFDVIFDSDIRICDESKCIPFEKELSIISKYSETIVRSNELTAESVGSDMTSKFTSCSNLFYHAPNFFIMLPDFSQKTSENVGA